MSITHPHHPLYGQQVDVIRIRRGADPDLTVKLPDSLHAAIAMSWTNYAAPPNRIPQPFTPHLFDWFDQAASALAVAQHFATP